MSEGLCISNGSIRSLAYPCLRVRGRVQLYGGSGKASASTSTSPLPVEGIRRTRYPSAPHIACFLPQALGLRARRWSTLIRLSHKWSLTPDREPGFVTPGSPAYTAGTAGLRGSSKMERLQTSARPPGTLQKQESMNTIKNAYDAHFEPA